MNKPIGNLGETVQLSSASLLSPHSLFRFVLVLIFVSESLIMFLLHFLPEMSPLLESFIDSTLLVVLITPSLYIFFLKPLVSSEMSERQKVEFALLDSERLFKAIFDDAFQWIGIVSPDGTILNVNKKALSIIGAGLAEVKGDLFWETAWWDHSRTERKKAEDAIKLAAKGEFVRYETSMPMVGDKNQHIDFSITPLRNEEGDVILLISEGRDISARKKVEEELLMHQEHLQELVDNQTRSLQSANKQYRALMEISPAGIFRADVRGNCFYVNSRWCSMTGLSQEKAYVRGWLSSLHEDDSESVGKEWDRFLDSAESFQTECRYRCKDGAVRWVQIMAVSESDKAGEVVGYIGMIADITEIKNSEEKLKRAKDIAEKANVAKSEFLANMSHELRTPMHAILSFAGMGYGKVKDSEQTKIARYFSNVHESGHRLLRLLNDLLDLSKLESGKSDFDMEGNDILKVLEVVSGELAGLLKEKSIKLTVIPTEIETKAVFDLGKIIQVLRNVISNAIKFSPNDETITVSLSDAVMPENGGEDGTPSIFITVIDKGVGIPESELELVFDKFIQSSKTKTGAGGTGLGLAICKEIMAAHGGDIRAENISEGGAVFFINLPRVVKPVSHDKIADEVNVVTG